MAIAESRQLYTSYNMKINYNKYLPRKLFLEKVLKTGIKNIYAIY